MTGRYLSKDVNFSKDMNEHTIKALHQHPAHGYLCITGGGASGLSRLLAEPGASSTILGADIPYSSTMLSSLLGGTLSSACSEDTAAMACDFEYLETGEVTLGTGGEFNTFASYSGICSFV